MRAESYETSINDREVSTCRKQLMIADTKEPLKLEESLVEIVQSLSAISEENAASTQETSASMSELGNTFSIINESASQLQVLAADLTETISYFK